MYDNAHLASYANIPSRPCRIQYSRWSLNSPEESINSLPSPLYFSQSQQQQQQQQQPVVDSTADYVNYYPSSVSSTSSSRVSHYERPRSTILSDPPLKVQSTFHVNELRRRYEQKAVIGIVKPMVHQLSYNPLNSNNIENKFPDMSIKTPYPYDSTRSLYPPPIPTPTLCPSTSSSIIYRTRPPISNHNSNGPPPIAPRRYSSISTNKRTSSRRSSRTTSTSSSIVGINEISSKASTHENEQQQQQQQNDSNNEIIIDVKRIEMFYGSVGTLVKAARSIARLYITTTRQLANFEDWSCQQLGVPVWIYNTVRFFLFSYDR